MKYLFLYIGIFFGLGIQAQNLVRNPNLSDVEFNGPIIGFYNSGIGSIKHWYWHWADNGEYNSGVFSAHDTACTIHPEYGGCPGTSTNNTWLDINTPLPYAGKGYGAIIFYSYPIVNPLFGVGKVGYAITRMEQELVQDTAYCTEVSVRFIEYRVGNATSCYTHDGLGLYFNSDSTMPTSRPWSSGIVPQVNGFGYITNKNNWRKLKGSFVANGDEEYLFIGNFDPISAPPMFNGSSTLCNSVDTNGVILFDAVYVYNCRDTLFSVYHKDTTVCYGQPVTLNPQVRGFKLQDSITTYHWQTPSASFSTPDSTLVANEPGLYTVEVEINHRFKSSTTFYVHWIPEPPDSNFLESQYTFCAGDNVPLAVPQIPKAQYAWSNGDTTNATVIQQPGSYELTVTTPCWQHSETFVLEEQTCEVRLFVPNSFTPNGDGTNDLFVFHCTEEPVKLWVFDRWGNTVYQSSNYKNDWDGTYNGQVLPTGAYTYLIEFEYIHPNATHQDPEGSKRQKRGVINILP